MRRFIVETASMSGIMLSMPAIALYENFRLSRALMAALPHMTVPTLLFHAREDDVCHPRNAEKIKRVHGGVCELIYMEDSYHMMHVDRERDLVAQMTADFFGAPEAESITWKRPAPDERPETAVTPRGRSERGACLG